MLPYLQLISFGFIHPLASNTVQDINLSSGINYLLAENGFGKTTFLDLIERSICSDAHMERYSSFIHKKASKDAFIKAVWVFDEEVVITQRLLDSGTRTELQIGKWNKNRLTKPEYSKFLLKKTGLSLSEMQKLFAAIYYKRENDLDLLGTEMNEGLEGIFEVIGKLTQGETEEALSLRGRIKILQAEVRALQDERTALLQNITEVNAVFQELEEKGKLDLEGEEWRTRELERKIEKRHERLESIREEMKAVTKDYETTVNYLNEIEEELRGLIREQEQVKADINFSKQQVERLEKLVKTPAKQDYLEYLEDHPLCPVCQTNLLSKVDERIKSSCPVCNTPWEEVDAVVRNEILSEFSMESFKPDPRVVRDLNSLKNDLVGLEAKLSKIQLTREEKQHVLHETRTRLVQLARIRRDLEEELETLMKEIKQFQARLVDEKSRVEAVKKQRQAPILQERIRELEKTINEKSREMKELKNQLPEKNDVRQVLEIFSQITRDVFGYPLSINIGTKQVKLVENEPLRVFSTLSWGEKYLVDMCLRISIWEYLIKEKVVHKGLLLIDSPEAALDNDRLQLLKSLLEEHMSHINVILTTRTSEFANQLKGTALIIRKKGQTSLFAFLT